MVTQGRHYIRVDFIVPSVRNILTLYEGYNYLNFFIFLIILHSRNLSRVLYSLI